MVDAELGEWTRLCEKRLANCEREHAHAQDRAERAGVDLGAFYAALARLAARRTRGPSVVHAAVVDGVRGCSTLSTLETHRPRPTRR